MGGIPVVGPIIAPERPKVQPAPVIAAPKPTITPTNVVAIGEKDQEKRQRLAKVRTGSGTGARMTQSVLGSATTDSKELLGS
jgi:hypothetical protein